MDLRDIFACSACGIPMDWGQAHFRVTCGCDRSDPGLSGPVGGLGAGVGLNIRHARPDDGPALKALCLRFFHHTDLIAYGRTYEITECDSLVAERDGRLVGLLAYVWRHDDAGAISDCLVVAFAVAGGDQGRGVGARLQDWLEGDCRGRGVTRMVLSTTNDNLPALYFYQRHGFRIAEVLPTVIQDELKRILGGAEPPGFGGIPVRDEIRLVKELGDHADAPQGDPA